MGERLAGRAAIITGGGSGIGRACALKFAAEGALVCAADVNEAGATETARLVEQAGGKAIVVRVDTSDEAACDAMVGRCVDAFGAVDVLVAAAGILGQSGPRGQSRMLAVETDLVRRVIDVNLYGVLFSDRAVARWLVANGRPGSIINLASAAAKIPTGSAGGAYSISKAGVWMLTKVLATELAPAGIRVNAIGPGFIDTPMTAPLQENPGRLARTMAQTPMGRPGRPEEIADAALFLASDESSYFTGTILHPAGGMFLG